MTDETTEPGAPAAAPTATGTTEAVAHATTKSEAKIDETLWSLAVPVGSIEYHPQNPRLGQVDIIAESLDRYGQLKPIVVQASTGYIVAGNHTHKAAVQLGWDFIAAVKPDISDEEALAFIVADNRTSDLGDYDNAILAPILEGLMLTGKLKGTGYTPDEVDDMLSAMDALPEVDADSEAGYAAGADDLAETYKNRNNDGAQRQFVLLYDEATAAEVEENVKKLKADWGVDGMRDVVAEALRRSVAPAS